MNTKNRIDSMVHILRRDFDVNITIGRYNPGDGWTRHSVNLEDWQEIKNGLTARECSIYLDGLFDMLRVQKAKRAA